MRFGPCVAAFSLALLTIAARADSTSITGSGGDGFSGTATIYATDNGDETSYTIYDITGTAGYGLGVTSLLAPGKFTNGSGQKNDNQLYPNTTPIFDGNGFAFTDTDGDTSYSVDIFYSAADAGYEAYLLDSDGMTQSIPLTLSLTELPDAEFVSTVPGDPAYSLSFAAVPPAATPEPSSLALLGTSFVGLATLLRPRKCC
jgi:hypothetical protein